MRFSSVQSFDQILNRIGKSVQLTNQVHSTDQLIDQLIDWLIDHLIDWLIDQLIDQLIDHLIDHLIDQLIDQLISKMTNQVNVTDQLINRMNMIGQQTILASLVS